MMMNIKGWTAIYRISFDELNNRRLLLPGAPADIEAVFSKS
jgi:hypothetical protein